MKSEDELKEIAAKACTYRKHLRKTLPNPELISLAMLAFWSGVTIALTKTEAHRACGIYYVMVGAELIENNGGTLDDSFSYSLAS